MFSVIWCTETNFLPCIFQGINKTRSYIITQSPVKDTIADLWRMINDYNCKIIVMLESAGVISHLDHIF